MQLRRRPFQVRFFKNGFWDVHQQEMQDRKYESSDPQPFVQSVRLVEPTDLRFDESQSQHQNHGDAHRSHGDNARVVDYGRSKGKELICRKQKGIGCRPKDGQHRDGGSVENFYILHASLSAPRKSYLKAQ
jgi:hypothetical protein